MNTKTKKLVMAALMASLTCVATMIIKIPSPMKGYMNLGDCIVLITGWALPPMYAFLAAGIGSALADVISGYMMYVPATFIIKGLMAVIAFYGYKSLHRKSDDFPARIISGIVAEIVMIFGYFVFEGVLYGFVPASANIPVNGVQGIVGLVIGVALMRRFSRNEGIL